MMQPRREFRSHPAPDAPAKAPASFSDMLSRAIGKRRSLTGRGDVQAFRVFSGLADGADGIFIDVYGPGAALIVYEGRTPRWFDAATVANTALEQLRPLGVQAVYLKPFAKDRSKLGGDLPPVVTEPAPLAGEALPEHVLVREYGWNLEIRLYDGLSTGLFLDQRENRAFVAKWAAERAKVAPPSVLNTFAYTCAFSVAAAIGGATTTSMDVSPRYLDWGKRNFGHNSLDAAQHRFAKMDTFEFFGYARRKGLRYDMIILDPPSFAAGSKRKGIRAWNSVAAYSRLVNEAASLLQPKGVIFASTNTQELCRDGRLEREVTKGLGGLGKLPRWLKLPPAPVDFAAEKGRFAACVFSV